MPKRSTTKPEMSSLLKLSTEVNMKTFTSAKTGNTYEVTFNDEIYARYDITLDGKWVQFALTEGDVAGSVAHFEGHDDGWYCLPRD